MGNHVIQYITPVDHSGKYSLQIQHNGGNWNREHLHFMHVMILEIVSAVEDHTNTDDSLQEINQELAHKDQTIMMLEGQKEELLSIIENQEKQHVMKMRQLSSQSTPQSQKDLYESSDRECANPN